VEGPQANFGSYEELLASTNESLDEYKEHINKMGLHVSDRKKLLALPFYLAKRQELPEPRNGQYEMTLFERLTGQKWYQDSATIRDEETKITEFDYENYFHPDLLKNVDTDSKDFLRLVRGLNLASKTEYERLQDNKASF